MKNFKTGLRWFTLAFFMGFAFGLGHLLGSFSGELIVGLADCTYG